MVEELTRRDRGRGFTAGYILSRLWASLIRSRPAPHNRSLHAGALVGAGVIGRFLPIGAVGENSSTLRRAAHSTRPFGS